MSAVESFERLAFKTVGCWPWRGHLFFNGYGEIKVNRKSVKAHRWAYEHHRGPIPVGLVTDHLCRNRWCVNPWHLELVTRRENVQRGKSLITHCPKGHEYTPDNTYWVPSLGEGRYSRQCRACRHDARARWGVTHGS